MSTAPSSVSPDPVAGPPPLAAQAAQELPTAPEGHQAHAEHTTHTTHAAFLRTDAVRADLDRRAARGGTLALVANGVQWAITVAGSMILARLLVPADFGLLAMVAIVTGFIGTLGDLGLSAAATQAATLEQHHVSALFRLNLRLSCLNSLLVAGLAPLLAWFYGEHRLVGITLALALGTLVMGASRLQQGLLHRQMRFATLVRIDLTATALSIGSAIALARAGAGYWALVAQVLVLQVGQALGLWLRCPWRPSKGANPLSLSRDPAMRNLLRYASYATATRVTYYIGAALDSVLVGKLLGASALGFYSRAQLWAMMPFHQVYFPVMAVAVSSMSRLQDDASRYRHYVRTALLGIFTIIFGGMAFLFVKAHDGLLLLLGGQWMQAIPLFRILTVGTVAISVNQVTRWFYLAEGRTHRNLQWVLIQASTLR